LPHWAASACELKQASTASVENAAVNPLPWLIQKFLTFRDLCPDQLSATCAAV
jgi:hypothetical protein